MLEFISNIALDTKKVTKWKIWSEGLNYTVLDYSWVLPFEVSILTRMRGLRKKWLPTYSYGDNKSSILVKLLMLERHTRILERPTLVLNDHPVSDMFANNVLHNQNDTSSNTSLVSDTSLLVAMLESNTILALIAFSSTSRAYDPVAFNPPHFCQSIQLYSLKKWPLDVPILGEI